MARSMLKARTSTSSGRGSDGLIRRESLFELPAVRLDPSLEGLFGTSSCCSQSASRVPAGQCVFGHGVYGVEVGRFRAFQCPAPTSRPCSTKISAVALSLRSVRGPRIRDHKFEGLDADFEGP